MRKHKKKIMEKMEKWSNYQGPKSDLKLGTIIEIFFYVKFGIFWFWGIDNLQKKFGSSISKFMDFFLMSNFCYSLALTQTKKMTSKSWTLEKNPQFFRQIHQIFVASCQYPKPQPY